MRNVSQASTTDLPTIPASGVAELGEDGLDPELVLLHQPPALRRHLTLGLMALVAAAAIMLVITLRRDVAYFFSRPEVQDLGEAPGLDPSTLVPNTFVRVAGTPMASETVHFGRVLLGGDYEVFPLAGQRRLFVQVPAPSGGAQPTSARREFAGRLVTLGQLGARYASLQRYLSTSMGMPVSADSYLVLADEPPVSYSWALWLGLLALFTIVVDFFLLLRWFRPLRIDRVPERAKAGRQWKSAR